MAQLNDTMVQGDLRVTGKIYGTENAIRVEDANLAIPPLGVGDSVGSTGDFFISSGSGKNLPNTVDNFDIHTTVTHYASTTYRLSQIATPTSSSNPAGIYERGASSSDGVTWTFGDWAGATNGNYSSVKIPANADLNNYNTDNRIYQCNATNASSVSNRPSGASGAFELEVILGTGSSCVQIYYSRDDVSFNYIRKYTGDNKWTSWEMMMSQDVSNKLNVDGSNATTDGVVAMMKKAPFNSTVDTPADSEYYYSDGSDKSIVRRSIRNIWNYIKGKLGSAGSSERPIYIENGVPKACDSVMPVSVIDSGDGIGYGVFVGGNQECGPNTRCFCALLITATANPDMTSHTYIGTFTFKAGKILNSELKCLTGKPQYPLRIGVVFNKNPGSTYSVGLYVIPADKTVNTYANYKLTRVASSAFTWSVQAMTEDTYDNVDTISKPSLIPIPLYWPSGGPNVTTTGGTWLPTFDKATILNCRGYVDLSVQVNLSLIGQTTYVGTLTSYSITLVNSSGTDIIPSSFQQEGPMPRQIKSTLNNALFTGTVSISHTHRFVFPITEKNNLLAGYRPKITLPSNYPLDTNARVSISVQCNGIVLPYCPTNTSF